jgi:hypothetical protein
MFDLWRATRGEPAHTESLIDELVAIGDGRGFIPGGRADKRTQQIGRALDKAGGMDLMQQVHAAVSRRVVKRSAPRELDAAWDDIGEWLG